MAISEKDLAQRRHTDREYEHDLVQVRDRVLLMGARAEEMMTASRRAFSERNAELARSTIESDSRIDAFEVEIDELCLLVLARRQPVASDLRFITATLKLVTDLERIGDLCVNICERVFELCEDPSYPTQGPLSRMGEAAQAMLHDALDAFVAGDAMKAEQVVERDNVVDAYYAQLFPELAAHMMRDPTVVFRSTRMLSIGKYIERIADHATNIGELVIFMVHGLDVRHGSLLPRGTPRT